MIEIAKPAEPEQLEEYFFTVRNQTAVLYHAELAAALALLPDQTQEEIFRYYFLRQPQRVIGVHIGRTHNGAAYSACFAAATAAHGGERP